MFICLLYRVFAKVKSRSAHMKIHRPDQEKEKEKKAKLAKQQAAAAAAAAHVNQRPWGYDGYSNFPNGPSQLWSSTMCAKILLVCWQAVVVLQVKDRNQCVHTTDDGVYIHG